MSQLHIKQSLTLFSACGSLFKKKAMNGKEQIIYSSVVCFMKERLLFILVAHCDHLNTSKKIPDKPISLQTA